MRSGEGVYELGRYANAVSGPADTALDHVARAKRTADLSHVQALTAECEGRVSGDYDEFPKAR